MIRLPSRQWGGCLVTGLTDGLDPGKPVKKLSAWHVDVVDVDDVHDHDFHDLYDAAEADGDGDN